MSYHSTKIRLMCRKFYDVTLKIGVMALVLGSGACSDDEPAASRVLRDMQAGQSSQAAVSQFKIAWSEPIKSTKFNLAANKDVDGKTLQQIITSQVSGRDDGLLCSSCHNNIDKQGGYGVPAGRNTASPGLKPNEKVGLYSWDTPGGWAEKFSTNATKPENLRIMVEAWMNNGYK
ncbi:MAG TPA: hypothetical protein VE954_02175 [Oligoflexus sp.]|uniref:hypothetical protein n=1 Tax=Oligoflexus sp. TaxID=1971216 RepID=UPI002D30B345|nr:hypothetical protein [Oligoflexus sp.]HYX31893.1 hypothetical protein [Oligoflexus sp.]